MIYLDHAATSMHKPAAVYEAVVQAMKACASLGRSGHEAALKAAEVAFACRVAAGNFFDAEPDQVVFTSNATHGLNIAIQSLVKPGDQVIVSGFEHNAVMRPLHQIGARIVVSGTKLFDPDDTLRSFETAITPKTSAVICTHVSNVFGYILPVEEIASICKEQSVPFILDASQSAGVLPVSLRKLNAAFIAMPGHKSLLGPQGTGLLLCGAIPKPLMSGGTGSHSLELDMPEYLPDRAEVGTHNIPGIAGLLAALNYLQKEGIGNIQNREQFLLSLLEKSLKDQKRVRAFFGIKQLQSGVLSFEIPHLDCEMVAQELANAGIAVRAGLHCAPLAHHSAGTLDHGTVRVSVSGKNTEAEIHTLVREIERISR